jgi:nicotinamidase/pyrazinamidase
MENLENSAEKGCLIVVDVQYDFCEGGSLPVSKSLQIIPTINKLRTSGKINYVVFSKDWHPEDHSSFSIHGGQWPIHCVQGSDGSKLRKELIIKDRDLIVTKGSNVEHDSYSAFYDDPNSSTALSNYLNDNGVTAVYICGLATDYCVYSTIIDAVKDSTSRGKYTVHMVTDASAGISDENVSRQATELEELGVRLIDSSFFSDIKDACTPQELKTLIADN